MTARPKIPDGVDDLTPEALTFMLACSPALDDVIVDGVNCSRIGTGQLANSYRLELSYRCGGDIGPTSVIGKIPSADEASRQLAAATGAYEREVHYYQRVDCHAAVCTPLCYYTAVAKDRLRFVVLMEDLAPARIIDQLQGCGPDEAALALGQAAALQGPLWRHPVIDAEPWLRAEQQRQGMAESIEHLAPIWLERFATYLDAEHVSLIEALGPHARRWFTTLARHRTLCHADFRLDNLLFEARDGDIPLAVVDWQSISTAPGPIDAAYFLGTSVPQDVRANYEQALVADYHCRLQSFGVGELSADQCWLAYRAHAIYGLVLTIPASLSVERTPRGDDMFGTMARRIADQMLANNTIGALATLTG
jgi:phosphotransferase family enzyme